METNDIWMHGSSVTPEEVAQRAFYSGLYCGLWLQNDIKRTGYAILPQMKEKLFDRWKGEQCGKTMDRA